MCAHTADTAGNVWAFCPLMHVPKYPCIIFTTGQTDTSPSSTSSGRMLWEKHTSGRHARTAPSAAERPLSATLKKLPRLRSRRVGPLLGQGRQRKEMRPLPASGSAGMTRGEVALNASAGGGGVVRDQDAHRRNLRVTPASDHGSGCPSRRSGLSPCRSSSASQVRPGIPERRP